MIVARPAFRRTALRVLLSVIAITICVAIFGVLLGGDERILVSCVCVVGGCLVSLLASWTIEQGRMRTVLVLACMVGVIDLSLGIATIWLEASLGRQAMEIAGRTLGGTAIAVMWCVLSITALNVRFRIWWWHTVPSVAIGLLTMLALTGVFLCISPDSMQELVSYFGGDVVGSALGVAGVLTAALMLALPMLRLLDRMPAVSREGALGSQHMLVLMRCPRCASTVEIQANEVCRCGTCGLQLRIELEEPRCSCGYLLHNLKAPMCPECGALVPLELNWREPAGAAVTPASGPRSP